MDVHQVHRQSISIIADQQISQTMYYPLEDLFFDFKDELESELEFHE